MCRKGEAAGAKQRARLGCGGGSALAPGAGGYHAITRIGGRPTLPRSSPLVLPMWDAEPSSGPAALQVFPAPWGRASAARGSGWGVWSPPCRCRRGWGVLQCTRRSLAVHERACGAQPRFIAADGSGAAAQLTSGCGLPGSRGPASAGPVGAEPSLCSGRFCQGTSICPAPTSCWKVPLPCKALL